MVMEGATASLFVVNAVDQRGAPHADVLAMDWSRDARAMIHDGHYLLATWVTSTENLIMRWDELLR